MNLAIVRFNDSNDDRIQAPRRAEDQNVLRQAIGAFRPPTESWTVVTHEVQDGTVLTFDFSRGTDVPRSFTFQPEGDDAQHSALFRTACQFLRVNSALTPRMNGFNVIDWNNPPRSAGFF